MELNRHDNSVKSKLSKISKGSYQEKKFFDDLLAKQVAIKDIHDHNFGGKLEWVGPYAIIISRKGRSVLIWKHSLKSIQLAESAESEECYSGECDKRRV